MIEGIILFSHGSVLCGAEQNLLQLAETMRKLAPGEIVEVGFLNYTTPDFATAVERCVAAGATRITIAPYFLISGKFVTEDLPGQIDEARARYPGVIFLTAPPIGDHPLLPSAVTAAAASPQTVTFWREQAALARPFCRANPRCPLYQGEYCAVKKEAVV